MSRFPEHACNLPHAELNDLGRLHLCTCGRLYVGREGWVDPVCPQRVCNWHPIRQRRWWRL